MTDIQDRANAFTTVFYNRFGSVLDPTKPTLWRVTLTEGADSYDNNLPDNDAQSHVQIYGLGGNDYINGRGEWDKLDGGGGNDNLWDTGGFNLAYGGEGNDTITFEGGHGVLDGGNGDDWLRAWGNQDDIIIGGAGIDKVDYYNINGSITVDLRVANVDTDTGWANGGAIGTDRIGQVENVTGAQGDDVIWGNTLNNVIDGWYGNDKLYGDWGNDTIRGNHGNDELYGWEGDDDLDGGNNDDKLYGEQGNDRLQGGEGNDYGDGGVGNDVVSGYSGNDTLRGGDGNDELNGQQDNDTLFGDAGNDSVYGSSGYDTLYGWLGDDYLDGGDQDDKLYGEQGNDQIRGGSGSDQAWGGDGNDLIYGGVSADTLRGEGGNDTIYGETENDVIYGGDGHDGLNGGANDDRLYGDFGDDTLWGMDGADTLSGGLGNDNLNGGAGRDTLAGGQGNDTYTLEDINFVSGALFYQYDTINEAFLLGGTDTVRVGYVSVGTGLGQTRTSYTLGDYVENGVVTGTQAFNLIGNASNNDLNGNGAANTLTGMAGNDRMSGGGGHDTLIGGAGDDIYYLDSVTSQNVGGFISYRYDTVTEAANEGTDTVYVRRDAQTFIGGTSYTLGDNIENGVVNGSGALLLVGNALNNSLLGGTGVDTLRGMAGDDYITGGGGADTFQGGAGNDTYWIDQDDIVDESVAGSDGIDTIQAGFTISLQTYANLRGQFENLRLMGTADIDGSGNELDNVINGNSGKNTLRGGAGNDTFGGEGGGDTLIGGTGNDTYHVNSDDVIVEKANQGTDRMIFYYGGSTYTLAAGAHVERMEIASTSTTARHMIGNELGQTMIGSDAANILKGMDGNDILNGGKGADRMEGGFGNDTFYVDNAGDLVIEREGEGSDLVYASVSYSINSTHAERLYLTGSAAISGVGNSLDNILVGNDGKNSLKGLAGNDRIDGGGGNDVIDGGVGADDMRGGAGDDIYYVDNASDRVTEAANAGTDLVYSSVTFNAASTHVERVYLTGTTAASIVGNSLANVLMGNAAANAIYGAGGADQLRGGGGADRFVYKAVSDSSFANYDRIVDLSSADRIDLSAIDANTKIAGNQAFALVDAFTGAGGQITLTYLAASGFTVLAADVNGDKVADMRIVLNGDHEDFTGFVL